MKISKIYIEKDVENSPVVDGICRKINAPREIVNDLTIVYSEISGADDPVKKGKEILCLTNNKGAFVRKCPGTSIYTCCDYKILHIGTFCFMDCSYCILQTYFHPPVLQFFVNHDTMLDELEQLFADDKISRVGTGEFTDSMIWEPWTKMSEILVPGFGSQQKAVLELKTKTVSIQRLKNLDHNRKTIISWSLNTEKVIALEERATASLSARLNAASQCEKWGYPLGFHFDPMVIYNGCEKDYCDVIKRLFQSVSPENIVWISIGTFRYMPSLKPIIEKRFPESKIQYGEFISGLDGKMRYFKPLRIQLYKTVVECIKSFAPDLTVYFCMEDGDVWRRSFGFTPEEKGGLPKLLDLSAVEKCGLVPD